METTNADYSFKCILNPKFVKTYFSIISIDKTDRSIWSYVNFVTLPGRLNS